jgi:hypothetical protein
VERMDPKTGLMVDVPSPQSALHMQLLRDAEDALGADMTQQLKELLAQAEHDDALGKQ